jgi:anti-sigma-K factor RskA
MMAREHEHWTEQGEIFALGALHGREREDFEAHLAAGCAICEAHVRETRETLSVLHRALKPINPPVAVKTRLFNQIAIDNVVPIAATRAKKIAPWRKLTGALAAGIIGLVIGGTYYRFHYEPRHTVYSSVINLLRDPATRDHPLYGAGPTPQARGRFLWNESGEGHIFATDLPTPPQGKMYAVWTIAQDSAPRYVGTITTDANGQGGLHINSTRSEKPIETFAVTLEPQGNTAAPSGPMVLVSKQS